MARNELRDDPKTVQARLAQWEQIAPEPVRKPPGKPGESPPIEDPQRREQPERQPPSNPPTGDPPIIEPTTPPPVRATAASGEPACQQGSV